MSWAPLSEVDDLAGTGREAEALSLLARYFELSRDSPGEAGVRLTFALDTWERLAERHPPARDALLAARDAARDRLMARASGAGDPASAMADHTDFTELAAINRQLTCEVETLTVYGQLLSRSPEKAEHCRIAAEHALRRWVEPDEA